MGVSNREDQCKSSTEMVRGHVQFDHGECII